MRGRKPRPIEIAPDDLPLLQQIAHSQIRPCYQGARSQKAVDPGTRDSPKRPVFPRNLIVLLCAPDVDLTITYLILLVYFRGLLT